MSTVAQLKLWVFSRKSKQWVITDSDGPLSDEVLSNHNSADPRENVLEDDDEGNTSTIK